MERLFIGVGSNIGDRLENIRIAFFKVAEVFAVLPEFVSFSSIYSSDALVKQGSPLEWAEMPFLNACFALEVRVAPLKALELLKFIERDMGRMEGKSTWSPRVIDLDVLLYGERKLNLQEEFTLPHASLKQRDFVLKPLIELMQELRMPIAEYEEALKSAPSNNARVFLPAREFKVMLEV